MFDDASKNPPGWSLRPRSSTRKNCRPEVSFNIMLTCHFIFFFYSSVLPSHFPFLSPLFWQLSVVFVFRTHGQTRQVRPPRVYHFGPCTDCLVLFFWSLFYISHGGLSSNWPTANSSYDRKQNKIWVSQ